MVSQFFWEIWKVVMMRILFEININLREFQIGIHNGMIFRTLQELDNIWKVFIFLVLQPAEVSTICYYVLKL